MSKPVLLLIADFNVSNLRALLAKSSEFSGYTVESAPYGQVMQTLLDPNVWKAEVEAAIGWTTPRAISAGYRELKKGQEVAPETLSSEVEAFVAAVRSLPAQVRHIFIPTWVSAPNDGRLGLLDLHPRVGPSLALLRMNVHLAECLEDEPRAHLLDASRWTAVHGENSFSQRLWYASKTPFSIQLFKEAVQDMSAGLAALRGQSRKLVLLDLDETLWGGILGDVGWEAVRLGGHDPVGEAFSDFQNSLKTLKHRGILLGIVSKNEEATALEAISSHPEMALRVDDFVGWRINWEDKARNIAELAAELNLGLQSVVFIDDNPVERDRVRATLPEVLVPEWPANPMEYVPALGRLRSLDQAHISAEDKSRSDMYVMERTRRAAAFNGGSMNEWLASLDLKVAVEELTPGNADRATQLLNKTNQMNLTTRRLGKEELVEWAAKRTNCFLAFRVADKFGDYGLVGIASFELQNDRAQLVDFILSCRVMGRKIEETMLHIISERAKADGAQVLTARHIQTKKNQPCLRFFQSAGLREVAANVFELDLSAQVFPKPSAVLLQSSAQLQTT